MDIDRKKSMVLLKENGIQGMILLRETAEEGTLEVTMLYLEKQYIKEGIGMLSEALKAALQPPMPMKRLRFCCVNQTSRLLAMKLFPSLHHTEIWTAHGILQKEFYQKRG